MCIFTGIAWVQNSQHLVYRIKGPRAPILEPTSQANNAIDLHTYTYVFCN